ncbi:MAG TPA: hypothetical protein VLD67_06065 [Vicinamibacterales bacterium]|nr:hypothetical protein [Vicinamibacterales bacterium]
MPRDVIRGFHAAALAACAAATVGCELQQPLMLTCTTQPGEIVDVVRLSPQQGQATLLSVSPPRSGSVQVSPTAYDVTFEPGTDGAPRLRLTINRYTFRSTRQEGGGADAAATGSTLTGVCERYRGRPF